MGKETERQRKINWERDRGERGEESGKEIMNERWTKEAGRERGGKKKQKMIEDRQIKREKGRERVCERERWEKERTRDW